MSVCNVEINYFRCRLTCSTFYCLIDILICYGYFYLKKKKIKRMEWVIFLIDVPSDLFSSLDATTKPFFLCCLTSNLVAYASQSISYGPFPANRGASGDVIS